MAAEPDRIMKRLSAGGQPLLSQHGRICSRLAGGHAAAKGAGMYIPPTVPDGQTDGKINKELDANELAVYEKLSKAPYAKEAVRQFIPPFFGTIENEAGETFICMGNLLHAFGDAKVMDVKVGLRTYTQSEAAGTKLRKDLYERMVELYPPDLSEEDHKVGAVTKYHWMRTRDAQSTIVQHGFRIDGMAGYRWKSADELRSQCLGITTREESKATFRSFAEAKVRSATESAYPGGHDTCASPAVVAKRMRDKARELHKAMSESSFVKEHEFVGTSLLFIGDAKGNVGLHWIDFAKTFPLPDGVEVSHLKKWENANHEDGLLLGICNILEMLDEIVAELQDHEGPLRSDGSIGGRVRSFVEGIPPVFYPVLMILVIGVWIADRSGMRWLD